jgi:two-component system sensor histidine kinase CpxA
VIRRSIFAKIFLWFWAALILVTLAVTTTTVMLGSQPLAQRWLAASLDLYAHTALDAYQQGGRDALNTYLSSIETNSGVQATLLDPSGSDLAGRGVPPRAQRVLEAARTAGASRFHTRFVWSGASVINRPEGSYFFVAVVHPFRASFAQPMIRGALLKFSIAILAAGVLCFLLARHFAEPIRKLQTVATRIAGGELSVRAKPLLPYREDELGELARDFDRMADRVESLLKKQQELLGDISHELRSPLTRMNVALELARRGDADSLSRMQIELDKLESLIAQILTLTKLEQSKESARFSQVYLLPLLQSIAEDATFEGKDLGKSVHISSSPDREIFGDASLLRSALENIIRNAVRYTDANTAVTVTLRSFPEKTEIRVQDHGPGVPASTLPHLFEPFFRVSESRDRNSGGVGLGLSIAQKVVLLHGGAISASNASSGGLEILISLPQSTNTQPADK